MSKRKRKPVKAKRKKPQIKRAGRPPMVKFSVCLPSVSVLGHIGRRAGSAGRSEADMAGWLLEAAFTVASSNQQRRLMPKKKWKLKDKCFHVRIPVATKFERPLTRFIRDFCTKEHLTVGVLVEEMLLASLEAFEKLSRSATSDQLISEIRRTYLK